MTRPTAVTAAALATAGLLAACSAAHTAALPPPAPQAITVAAVPGEGAAGLYIAHQQRLFAKAGLRVTIETVTSAATAIPDLVHGEAQVVSGQYDSFISADAHGIAQIRLLAAGYALGPRVQQIMVPKGSPIRSPAQLRGATIAVNALNSLATDLLYTALAPYGITPGQVHVAAVPFPAMPAALAAHRFTAAYMVEPYATEAEQQDGDQPLLDLDAGAALGFPISGYAALASWARQHPAAAAAFTRAVEQGNQLAGTGVGDLRHALETGLHISPFVADVMATGVFPTSANQAQIQRVADLMQRYGQLAQPFDVAAIIR
jgi:NitT/TauT family transport system substrate-binding protein